MIDLLPVVLVGVGVSFQFLISTIVILITYICILIVAFAILLKCQVSLLNLAYSFKYIMIGGVI